MRPRSVSLAGRAQKFRGEPLPYLAFALRAAALPQVAFYTFSAAAHRPILTRARHQATLVADRLRRHGPWEPHRLPLEEVEYTTMPAVAKKIATRWQPLE